MMLRFSGDYRLVHKVETRRQFESMGKGLLLVRLEFSREHLTPYHWFLENKRKPPFDVALNPKDGSITYIKFFFQDEQIKYGTKALHCIREDKGFPLFDISYFNDKNYHLFESGNIEVYLYNKAMYVKVSGLKEFRNIKIDEQNSIIVDEQGSFAGLIMKEITEVETNELVRAALFQ